MTKKKIYLIAYDIVDNKIRNKVCRVLQNYAVSGQASCYECALSPQQKGFLKHFLSSTINWNTDQVLILRYQKAKYFGIAKAPEEVAFLL